MKELFTLEDIESQLNKFIDSSDRAIQKNVRETVKEDFLEFLNPSTNPDQTELFDDSNKD